jgi:fucose 4-O-acetylase-like acetyltransferase
MGRRKTMLYGAAGLGICMMMASILLSFGKKKTSSAAVAFFFIYMIIFGGTINVVPWVYVSWFNTRSCFHVPRMADLTGNC